MAALAEVGAGDPRIIGVGSSPSEGIKRGMVTDLTAAAAAISQAVAQADRGGRLAGEAKAVLGVSGPHVRSVVGRAEVMVEDPSTGVAPLDVERATNSAGSVELPEGRQVIHVIPLGYQLDGAEGVTDPVGLAGRILTAEAHLITVDGLPVQNYLRAAIKAGVQVADYQLGLYAAAEAVLTKEERQAGTLVLDMGAGLTGMAIYAGGRLHHVQLVPVGAEHITRDLASVLQVPVHVAERLKTERGWATVLQCPDTSLELISPGQKTREMQDRRLAQIIEPRVQEIFHLVAEAVKNAECGEVPLGSVVLTGGGARLKGIAEAASNWFGMPARIGVPSGASGDGPEFSTAVGLVHWGAAAVQAGIGATEETGQEQEQQDNRGGHTNWLSGLFS